VRSHGVLPAKSLPMGMGRPLHLITCLGDQMLLRNIPCPTNERTPLMVWHCRFLSGRKTIIPLEAKV
jgi:hypothetical protein